jgi:protein-L-isoaspartate(D-aspartate) O-methyltransferase
MGTLDRPVLATLLACAAFGCGRPASPPTAPGVDAPPAAATTTSSSDGYATARADMVRTQIEARGVKDPRVLAAMRRVPRHEFVPPAWQGSAYDDRALSIGHEQTISQPYIVAVMTEAARVGARARVLEIGTGSGYQAAILAELAAEVYSIEIVEPLARAAATTLKRLGYERIHLRTGDGYRGWPEAAPFDAILVTAAPPEVPRPLVDQLAPGGRLVIPVGDDMQELRVITRDKEGVRSEVLLPVRFVPMTGEAQAGRDAG